jgi:hypothetical protein
MYVNVSFIKDGRVVKTNLTVVDMMVGTNGQRH